MSEVKLRATQIFSLLQPETMEITLRLCIQDTCQLSDLENSRGWLLVTHRCLSLQIALGWKLLFCPRLPGAACIQHGSTKGWPLPCFRTSPELPGELMEASLPLNCSSTFSSAQSCFFHAFAGSVPESTCQKNSWTQISKS